MLIPEKLRKFKTLFLVLAIFAGSLSSFGQDFLPVLSDNYMGINQAFLQPAAIVGSPLKIDINVAGFNNDIYNDGMRFRSRWILYPTQIVSNDDWWDENTYLPQANGKDKNMFFSQSAIGPSFLVTVKPNIAIGFTSRVRSLTNIDNMDEPLFRLMYSNYQDAEYYNKWYSDGKMRASQHIFGDYGFTYAQTIPINRKIFGLDFKLNAGATLKLIQGIACSYIQTHDLYYYFNGEAYPESKDISWNSPYVEAGISDNWGDLDQYGNYSFSMNYQFTAKPTLGADIGLVFILQKKGKKTKASRDAYIEFSDRTQSDEILDTLDQFVEKDSLKTSTAAVDAPILLAAAYTSKTANQTFVAKPSVYEAIEEEKHSQELSNPNYLLKLGVSLLDISSLNYKKDYYSSDLVTAFTPDYFDRKESGDNSVPGNTYWLDANNVDFNFRNYVNFSQEMHQRTLTGHGAQKEAYNKESFYIKLPLAISLQADFSIPVEGLYLNLTYLGPLIKSYQHSPNSHYISNISITPRYEKKWVSVSIPLQRNEYNKWAIGLGIRAGIFYFGVNNLFSTTFSDPYGINAYAGVKVPIYPKKHYTILPPVTMAENIGEKEGCHNTVIDNDYTIIQDSFNQMTISEDRSINTSGNPSKTEAQGMATGSDNGNAESNKEGSGSGSGNVNSNDSGSDNGGSNSGSSKGNGSSSGGGSGSGKGNGGSNVGGTGSGKGTGGSGQDSGGTGSGKDIQPENSHIPPQTSSNEQPMPERTVKPIYFAFGDSRNSQMNKEFLDSLSMILKSSPYLRLTIEGYTDNVGSEEFNMKLSRIRAEETKQYLIEQGVNEDQLAIAWYGESRPVVGINQDTEDGRKANRRVEFKFENT